MIKEPNTQPEPPAPRTTGNTIVLFKEGVSARQTGSILNEFTGVRSVDRRDFGVASDGLDEALKSETAVLFDDLGVAVLSSGSVGADARAALASRDDIVQVRPEFFLFAIPAPTPPFLDTRTETWGLAATGVTTSPYSGKGIRIAVLDTGFAQNHPDFQGRTVVSQSFVPNETAVDVQGHGTHCIGTAAGSKDQSGRRYGVAHDASIYVGKVLDNGGSGAERWILSGMTWAVQQGCQVISMSLGRPTQLGEPPDPLYERAGRLALTNGSLIIAAAGNDSSRQYGHVAPVSAPANSSSIMAVAAVDQMLQIAEFSSGGMNGAGGEINIAAPGVGVYSSVPPPQLYRSLPGTSMACPHVAGIAALWAEADQNFRGQKLWEVLVRNAAMLNLPARDAGAGLVQAPPSRGMV